MCKDMITKSRITAFTSIVLAFTGCAGSINYKPHSGDILFQTSLSKQSRAIELATKSQYSHVGLVYIDEGKPMVLEAIEPVGVTPLVDWIAKGKEGRFVAKRFRDADDILTDDAINRMIDIGRSLMGKNYDKGLDWSDDRMYCTELAWKIYKRALGLEVGQPQTLGEFDLTDPIVQEVVTARWGESAPLDENIISPAAMFNSDLLEVVFEN
jgi:hypothetical protein